MHNDFIMKLLEKLYLFSYAFVKYKIVLLKLTYFTYFCMFALVKMISQDFYNLNVLPYNQTIVVLRRSITMFILEA